MDDCYKSFVTPTFKKVTLPYLSGTEKQIAYANSIRDKYTNIFIRKVQLGYNPVKQSKEIDELIVKFQNYVNHPDMRQSYMWIDNHCSKCGCFMSRVGATSICTNEYCGFQKENSFYTQT